MVSGARLGHSFDRSRGSTVRSNLAARLLVRFGLLCSTLWCCRNDCWVVLWW